MLLADVTDTTVSDTLTFGLLLRKLNLASRGNFSGNFVRWLPAGDDAFRRQGTTCPAGE
jgi:hypothetical protein